MSGLLPLPYLYPTLYSKLSRSNSRKATKPKSLTADESCNAICVSPPHECTCCFLFLGPFPSLSSSENSQLRHPCSMGLSPALLSQSLLSALTAYISYTVTMIPLITTYLCISHSKVISLFSTVSDLSRFSKTTYCINSR